ncbi:protein MpBELL5 [Marchantia polymorpha subsp. ruderalis]|uniref:Homeobox domain-containing protein n=2 Tax=Marchantia polymorpha TaxID=3197 RepID=A0AAF6BH55_MARPO|nr:hypothetical protein MARPO_0093s0028 [Marchantia polymorpha]PTQ32949.1 hypothetical protein MARPO_0093s0028 [Marchantia polymorpha]BBN11338.1 hypothetical protein Mp_5g11060 [Marchantia polymorpha subsp. ruderalis]BBN11339.1 hypothetical protein Mp_5g11060 [Marchantia polymorpha subsp. ruderalis]|eukprot:PTQ32948.1 hypothetical protein MARPO_0093s0028 [Marchantia polymorpha]
MVYVANPLETDKSIEHSQKQEDQPAAPGIDSMSRASKEVPRSTVKESESSDLQTQRSAGPVQAVPELHRILDSTNELWRLRGGAVNNHPTEVICVPDGERTAVPQISPSDYLNGTAKENVNYINWYQHGLTNSMPTGRIVTCYAGNNPSDSSTRGETGRNVDISVLTSFHKVSSEEKWDAQALYGDVYSDDPLFHIVPSACPGTASGAVACSEIEPKKFGIGFSTEENVCDLKGQRTIATLEGLKHDEPFAFDDYRADHFFLADPSGNQTLDNCVPELRSAFRVTNSSVAETVSQHLIHHGETSQSAVHPQEKVLPAPTSPIFQLEQYDDIMIFNHHAQQWQDELMNLNYHEANAEGNVGLTSGYKGSATMPVLPEQPQFEAINPFPTRHAVSAPDVATDCFSFWPGEHSSTYHSLEDQSTPYVWPGSPTSEQALTPSYPTEAGTSSYTWKTTDSSLVTAAVDDAKPEKTARKHGVPAEPCASSGDWLESRGSPTCSMSPCAKGKQIAVSTTSQIDKISICQRVSAEQGRTEMLEMLQTVFPDSLDLSQEDNKHVRDARLAWLQEHAKEDILQNSKRDRTNSTEMLSRPTSSLRKKKQKDQEIPEGRLRGTSICTDPDLSYGLAAVQNVLEDFHKSAGLILKAKKLQNQRPSVTDLLNAELEALCIGDALGPEVKGFIMTVIKIGHGKQPAATNPDMVEQILQLKWRLASLMEESRNHERSTLAQLRDTFTRYSFLFPSSASDSFDKRAIPSKYYQDLENVVCQYFRGCSLFFKRSASSASSSSGQQGHENSSNTGGAPDVHAKVRGPLPVEVLGEANAGTSPVVETSDRSRMASRKELSGARGNLPKVAADYMRQWLFQNFQNPNPTRETKLMIATMFNITEKQVTNHFVNLRARKFRPLLRSLQEDPRSDAGHDMQNPDAENKAGPEGPTSAKCAEKIRT